MCKPRFDSKGMILNVFFLNHVSKYVNGTRDPSLFMANAILKFQFIKPFPNDAP